MGLDTATIYAFERQLRGNSAHYRWGGTSDRFGVASSPPNRLPKRMTCTISIGCAFLWLLVEAVCCRESKMCRMESSFTLLRVAKAAETLVSGYGLVGLQPTGHASPGQRLCRCQGYYRQFADRLEFLLHFHMLVFAPDAGGLVPGDRVGNPLLHIPVE